MLFTKANDSDLPNVGFYFAGSNDKRSRQMSKECGMYYTRTRVTKNVIAIIEMRF